MQFIPDSTTRASHQDAASAPAIRRVASQDEAAWCAALMAASEPWSTLGRDVAASLRSIADPTREAYIARLDEEPAGFIVLTTVGAFSGYIQSVCVVPAFRRLGVGSHLLAFAEAHILRSSPNVFLCVSSFNADARRLYERRGYAYIGALENYLVAGHSELLFRKTTGPWSEFVPRS